MREDVYCLLRMRIQKLSLKVLVGVVSFIPTIVLANFNGSVSVTTHQRFFDDAKLGNVNHFSEWGAIGFDVNVGLLELPYRLEPILGLGFIKNSAALFNLNDDGSFALDDKGHKVESRDKIEYQFFTASVGLREKFWDPKFFFMIPYVQSAMTYRYGRVRKRSFAEGQQKLNVGGDFGAEIGGGLLISFFYDSATRIEMGGTWDMKDFCLQAQVRYLPAGFGSHGLGLLSSTGGWDFGAGLFMDW